MKRYRPSSCNWSNWMKDGVMLERDLGEYVKHEDVVQMLFSMMRKNDPTREEAEYRIEVSGE